MLARNAILPFKQPSNGTKSEDIASEHTEGSVQYFVVKPVFLFYGNNIVFVLSMLLRVRYFMCYKIMWSTKFGLLSSKCSRQNNRVWPLEVLLCRIGNHRASRSHATAIGSSGRVRELYEIKRLIARLQQHYTARSVGIIL
ncbi:unnamed protein product [Aphis gossypii]|uniref:Uncharacterized protein n=1 Tax=Aphis gossypii TaxID=80765 RepID=A0A9P0NU90_APHGO|nr:unnamed protein product [Aphis gossypii]